MVQHKFISFRQCRRRITARVLALLAAMVMVGCAGSGGKVQSVRFGGGINAGAASIGTDNPGSVQVRIGDDPAIPDDRIVALRLDIASMRLWNSTTGDAIDVLAEPISVELVHSSTTTVPIAQSPANPNTTYDRLDIAYASAGVGVSWLDFPSGTAYNEKLGRPADQTIDLSSSPITLQSDPLIVDINVNVPSAVSLPPVGSVRAPVHGKVVPRPMASGASLGSPLVIVSQSSSQSGQIQYLNGKVTMVNGNSLTLKTSSNTSFTFRTDSNTEFENITLRAITQDMTIEVSGSTQADGSLYADEVELVDVANGVDLLGLVSRCDANVSMSQTVQDGIGFGMSSAIMGKTVNSQLDQASYSVSPGDIDMSGVTETFDAMHIFPGQQVETESVEGIQSDPDGSAGLVLPFMVELEQQTISGTAANYQAGEKSGTGTFDVILPTNGSSPLVTLNPGLTLVHVYRQTTTFPAISSSVNSKPVQVRGLLLCQNDNSNGQPCTTFVMVAAQVTVND